jgi:hypothetical protein
MHVAAIIAWVATAGGGLLMAAIWAAKGGLHQRDAEPATARSLGAAEDPSVGETNLSLFLVASHLLMGLLALGILVYWVARRDDPQTGVEPAPWLALASLVVGAGFGAVMVRRWAADRQARRRGQARVRRPAPADQAIPAPIVALHGAAAAVTLALFLLVALRIGT